MQYLYQLKTLVMTIIIFIILMFAILVNIITGKQFNSQCH